MDPELSPVEPLPSDKPSSPREEKPVWIPQSFLSYFKRICTNCTGFMEEHSLTTLLQTMDYNPKPLRKRLGSGHIFGPRVWMTEGNELAKKPRVPQRQSPDQALLDPRAGGPGGI